MTPIGTTTGRQSSAAPELQRLTTPGPQPRKAGFNPNLAADYSALERRVAASVPSDVYVRMLKDLT